MFQTFEDLLKPDSVIATSVGVIDTFQVGILCLCTCKEACLCIYGSVMLYAL